jgi:hypothetical protein
MRPRFAFSVIAFVIASSCVAITLPPSRSRPSQDQDTDSCGGHLCSGHAWYPVAETTMFNAVFNVPGLPTNVSAVDDPQFCHYIYFNIFFPNNEPTNLAVYNQFVPQLMLGDALSGSSGAPDYTPTWSNFTSYVFQAQYFFAFIDTVTNSTIFKAATGTTYNTSPGELLWTSFTLSNSSSGGSWTLSMGVTGDPTRTSTVTVPAPYMGMLSPFTTRWDEDTYSLVHVNSCWELYGTNNREDYPSTGSNFTMKVQQIPKTFPWSWSTAGVPPNCSGHPETSSIENHNATTQVIEWDIFWNT